MKTLIENYQRKQNKIGFGEAICLWCGKKMWKSSATQKYHGPWNQKGTCAYQKYSLAWREGFKKRRAADPEKFARMTKDWLKRHPGYMQEYGKKYRATKKLSEASKDV